MTTNNDDTTLEVVRDDQGSAAWRECTPDGECTTSRQRLDEKACNAARATLEVLVADANGAAGDALQALAEAGRMTEAALASFAAVIGLAATALRWTLPIPWESKRRARRRYWEAKWGGRVQLGAGWGLGLTEVASGVEKLRKAMKSAGPWEERSDV